MAVQISVAVIGLGSRGCSVLERIVTHARLAGPAGGTVRVEVIDPTCSGAGVHDPGQPDYLLLNTTCAQVSMFPDACTVGGAVDGGGPALYDWVTERGLRIAEDGFTVGSQGRAIRPVDFLPRRVLGEYLGWFVGHVLRRVPPQVQVRLHRAAATGLSSLPDGGLAVALSDGTEVRVGHAFLTTGYTGNVAEPPAAISSLGGTGGGTGQHRRIAEPYPLPARTAAVRPGESVAVGGFGLSAMDLMSCLTVGRGGRFVPAGDGLRYLPSGREPVLLMYSRSGAPCRARPLVVEFGPRYEPLVFTPAAIDRLRAQRGGPLDFDADVLPLVLTEMRVAYRRCEARLAGGDAEAALRQRLADAARSAGAGPDGTGPDAGGLDAGRPGGGGGAGVGGRLAAVVGVLDGLDARCGPFDAAAAFDGATDMLTDSSDGYRKWLADALRRDLAEGLLGFAGSPVKAALDILRDLRDTFRHVVDFGGLTPSSLDAFTERTVPAVNRAVVGPQYERHVELLALMAAGVADTPFGPAPAVAWNERGGRWVLSSTRLATPHEREVDWLVSAQVPPPAVGCSASPLLAGLHRDGWVRPHRPASRQVPGIDVDRDQHPLSASGRPDRRLWVLGPLCEGATFYNNLVPSPNTYSRPIFDAHRCVEAMFAAASGAKNEAK